MTQFSDHIYLGGAATRISSDNNGGRGVGPCNAIFVYDITPLTLQAANIAALQTTAGATTLTLTAGTGVTAVVRTDGTSVLQLDVPRNISLTSAANISAVTFTVAGYDFYGQAMTETITGPNANTVGGAKAFYQIASITTSAAVGTNTSVGTGDKYGLPFVSPQVGYVINISWAGVQADDAGTYVAAVTTDPATSTTGDVRGTYLPSSASNGTNRLVLTMAFTNAQLDQTATRNLTLGITQA